MKEKNQSIHPTLHAHDQKPHCLHCISAVFSRAKFNAHHAHRDEYWIARYLGPRSRSYKRWSLVTRGCSTVSHPPACVRCISILVVSHPACKKSPGKKENAMCTLCYKILVKQVEQKCLAHAEMRFLFDAQHVWVENRLHGTSPNLMAHFMA